MSKWAHLLEARMNYTPDAHVKAQIYNVFAAVIGLSEKKPKTSKDKASKATEGPLSDVRKMVANRGKIRKALPDIKVEEGQNGYYITMLKKLSPEKLHILSAGISKLGYGMRPSTAHKNLRQDGAAVSYFVYPKASKRNP